MIDAVGNFKLHLGFVVVAIVVVLAVIAVAEAGVVDDKLAAAGDNVLVFILGDFVEDVIVARVLRVGMGKKRRRKRAAGADLVGAELFASLLGFEFIERGLALAST